MFTIAPASPADLEEAAAVLATAFRQDTVTSTLVSGSDRERRLALLFEAMLRSGAPSSGRVDLARRDTDGVVLGVAVWEMPDARHSVLDQVRQLPTFARALGLRGLPRAMRLQRALASHRPVEPHWYLAQIGVGDGARGAGVGGALLESRLRSIDADGLPVYLESSNERNRALYRRSGFRSIASITGIPGVTPAAMWRDAARSAPVSTVSTPSDRRESSAAENGVPLPA
ncbi:GNAT family N-acetyltransferase [Plantibacter sp. M259]|uniref:GNAT family N-acetyltransferase n=1 Tax=Plantibacter sp. M259 TaxID=2583822 RepID=UPI00111061F1|nr:GNAT family N-acetyltransferase [Plantibacter sp. M259]